MTRRLQFLALLLVFLMLHSPAHACKCSGEPSIDQAVADSDFVFEGTVTRIEAVAPENIFILYTFDVTRVLKGKDQAQAKLLSNGNGGTSCNGFNLPVYGRARIFAKMTKDGYTSAIRCGTRPRYITKPLPVGADPGNPGIMHEEMNLQDDYWNAHAHSVGQQSR